MERLPVGYRMMGKSALAGCCRGVLQPEAACVLSIGDVLIYINSLVSARGGRVEGQLVLGGHEDAAR